MSLLADPSCVQAAKVSAKSEALSEPKLDPRGSVREHKVEQRARDPHFYKDSVPKFAVEGASPHT